MSCNDKLPEESHSGAKLANRENVEAEGDLLDGQDPEALLPIHPFLPPRLVDLPGVQVSPHGNQSGLHHVTNYLGHWPEQRPVLSGRVNLQGPL